MNTNTLFTSLAVVALLAVCSLRQARAQDAAPRSGLAQTECLPPADATVIVSAAPGAGAEAGVMPDGRPVSREELEAALRRLAHNKPHAAVHPSIDPRLEQQDTLDVIQLLTRAGITCITLRMDEAPEKERQPESSPLHRPHVS